MFDISPELLGYISLFITVLAYMPYGYALIRRSVKPHVFSWILWALLTGIGFFAQCAAGAGPGAWAMGLTSVACGAIAVAALFMGERNITKLDLAFFLSALIAILLWILTKNPLFAVVLITIIDVLAYAPTFRKSWHAPHEENVTTFAISTLKFFPALLAIQDFNWTTALFPITIVIMNSSLIIMLMYRRFSLTQNERSRPTL